MLKKNIWNFMIFYLLKIEQEEDEVDSGMLDSILEIPKIITAYQIETDNIKSKQNLII